MIGNGNLNPFSSLSRSYQKNKLEFLVDPLPGGHSEMMHYLTFDSLIEFPISNFNFHVFHIYGFKKYFSK